MFNDYTKQRRVVGHGAMTPGCSFWAPISLDGEVHRNIRPFDKLLTTERKLEQSSVQYQPRPKAEESCSSCMHYSANKHACQRVDGVIREQGWCILWCGEN